MEGWGQDAKETRGSAQLKPWQYPSPHTQGQGKPWQRPPPPQHTHTRTTEVKISPFQGRDEAEGKGRIRGGGEKVKFPLLLK